MDRMHSMFNNAFSTKAGQLIEKATAATLTSEDWGLNMEICDCINSYDDGPKDAVKAMKRRFSNSKTPNQIFFTLTVLETCVKNCGNRLHILVTSKEFCNEVLMKLIQPKNAPTLALQNKVLGMIQEWAETFKNTAAMKGVVEVHEELKIAGWEFPQPDKAAAAPIITPKRSVPPVQPVQQPQMQPMFGAVPPQQTQRVPPGARPSTGPITPSQEQMTKLQTELQVVLSNVQVMSEMLTELVPENTEASDLELLQELNRTCRSMQQRVVELVERVANEELTVELLKVNDDLNNVFLRYERFERYRASHPASKQVTTPNPVPPMMQQPSPYSQGPAPYQQGPAPYPQGPAPYPQGPAPYSQGPAPYPQGTSLYPPQHSEPPPSYSDTEQPNVEVNDLIDLGAFDSTPATAAPPTQPNIPAAANELTGLSLDQLMMTPSQPAAYPSLSQDLAAFDQSTTSVDNSAVTDMTRTEDEIAQWLQAGGESLGSLQQPQNPIANGSDQDSAAITDDFNAFLTERVAAGDQLPTLPDVPTDPIGQTSTSDGQQRKLQSGNQPMFGL